MKSPFLRLTIALAICLISPVFSLATNYTNSGSSQAYDLYNGDTLRISSGTYQGGISTLNPGSVIIVTAGATFKPGYMNSPAGKIINYGNCVFGGIGTVGGFKFENYNQLTVTGDLALYDGVQQIWNNNVAARMDISGSLYLNNTILTNSSYIGVGGSVAFYTSTSNLVNKGLINIAGSFSISNGVLNNQNRIYTGGDFNAWGGQVINEGSINPKGNMTFNTGTSYTNKCLMITNAGFTNYGSFQNNGLLWVGRTNTATDHFYNSGNFTNAADAVVKTVKLTNYSTLNGGGSYYINGDSYSSGTVGTGGATTDSIKVYDVTRTNSNSIFDVQYGTVYANVIFKTVALPDTNSVNYSGCSSFYKSDLGVLLPIEWKAFDARLVQGQPLITWSAQFEAGMKFEVERSYDNANFTSVATISSNNTKTYSYTDASFEKNNIIYYRIKATSAANGAVKYTETKMVKTSSNSTVFSVYPNPTKGVTTINYKAEKSGQVTILVHGVTGQNLLTKTNTVANGVNSITLTEVAEFKNGTYIIELINAAGTITSTRIIKQ